MAFIGTCEFTQNISEETKNCSKFGEYFDFIWIDLMSD